jgi:Brp/Blh family beta-carotene 15,15'-monooxygenase
VLGVPLLAWPTETSDVAMQLVSLVGGDRIAAATGWFTPGAIRVAGIVLLAAAVAALAAEMLATRHTPGAIRRSRETLVDMSVIALLGIATDPLFSVGVYFLAWHAWRHLWLLSPLVAGVRPSDPASLFKAVVRLHLAALPLLLPTWGAVLTGWWWLSPDHSARDLAILSLGVYLVVTPSHDLLIDFLRGHTHAEATNSQRPAVPSSCAARLACSSS